MEEGWGGPKLNQKKKKDRRRERELAAWKADGPPCSHQNENTFMRHFEKRIALEVRKEKGRLSARGRVQILDVGLYSKGWAQQEKSNRAI